MGLWIYHFLNKSHSFELYPAVCTFIGTSIKISFIDKGTLYGFQKATEGYMARASLLSGVQVGTAENLNSTKDGSTG